MFTLGDCGIEHAVRSEHSQIIIAGVCREFEAVVAVGLDLFGTGNDDKRPFLVKNLLSGVAMRKQWKKKALLGKARRWRDGVGQGSLAKENYDIANDDYDYAAAAARNKRLGLGI